MEYRTGDRIRATWFKTRELVSDFSADIDLFGRNVRQGFEKVKFSRQTTKLQNIAEDVYDRVGNNIWNDKGNIIQLKVYIGRYSWEVSKGTKDKETFSGHLDIRGDDVHFTAYHYDANGDILNSTVVLQGTTYYGNATLAMQEMIDAIGSPKRFESLPLHTQD